MMIIGVVLAIIVFTICMFNRTSSLNEKLSNMSKMESANERHSSSNSPCKDDIISQLQGELLEAKIRLVNIENGMNRDNRCSAQMAEEIVKTIDDTQTVDA